MRYDFNPLGDPRIKVAVLDGPVDVSHPCFDGATIEIPWGMPKTAPGSPASCHGTHIASILFGQPGSPVHGLVPCCRGLILPIFRDTGEMDVSCTQRDLARAILAAIDQGAHIVAISGGEPGTPEAADAFLVEAIGRCLEDNVLVVAAAGNDGASLAHIPAAMSGVLAVGACDLNGKPLSFSNFAEVYTDHGILAPGSEIVGAVPGGGVVSRSGTSFAVPIVAGLAARMLAETVQRGDIPNPVAVGRSLIANAVGCGEYLSDPDRCLSGRINPFQSLAARNTGARSESRFATGSGGMVMSELAEELERTEAGPGGVRAASDHSPDEVGRQDSAGLKQSVLSTSDCGCGCGGGSGSGSGCGCGCGSGGGSGSRRPRAARRSCLRLGYPVRAPAPSVGPGELGGRE